MNTGAYFQFIKPSDYVPTTGVTLPDVYLLKDGTYTYTPTVTPSNATFANKAMWSWGGRSSNGTQLITMPGYAWGQATTDVNAGTVQALAEGTTWVKMYCPDTNINYTADVQVHFLEEGKEYYVRNRDSGMQLGVNNQNTPGVSFVWQEDEEFIPSQQFVFESVNKTTPYLYIKNVYSNLYLGVYDNSTAADQGLRLYNKDASADGQKFHVIRTTDNYFKISPKTGEGADPDMVLAPSGNMINTNLIMQKNIQNNSKHEWAFGSVPEYTYNIGVSMFYDNAFRIRYGNDSDLDTQQMINDMLDDVEATMMTLFGLKVHNLGCSSFTSVPDQCVLSRGLTLSSTTITQMCPANPSLGGTCPNYADNKDCTDHDRVFDSFIAAYGGSRSDTKILFTGHSLFDETGTQCNRSFADPSNFGVCLQEYVHPSLCTSKYYYPLIHELSHIIGAPDHYHDLVNGVCQNSTICSQCSATPRPRDCVMGYRTGYTDLVNGDPWDIYCAFCYADIMQKLNSSFDNVVIWED